MARRWQTIEVQLVGGAHLDVEHPAGRSMMQGVRHSESSTFIGIPDGTLCTVRRVRGS